ncbi:hypothetical protein JOB18_048388 [Solea senegalensis]|uniref:Uncharacterized protein n=1 Tax=Solea senegalensis TaxID=28829 RepID=A0AAV6RF04_SOLSE|nr:hypothetical protein JOB18_048388 [Solea senegalensis]
MERARGKTSARRRENGQPLFVVTDVFTALCCPPLIFIEGEHERSETPELQ